MEAKRLKYPSINGLRAVSIVLVIIHHLCLSDPLFSRLENVRWLRPLISFLQDGQLGVNVFFVISGFLITSLMLEEENITKTISLKHFYIRRTLRIFPAYYFLLFVYFILQLLNLIHISEMSWLTAITYTKYFNWESEWLTAHAWSLSVEEQFYLFWPLIFVYGFRYRKAAPIILILTVPVIRIFLSSKPDSWIYDLTIFTRIDSIATGCLFALYKERIVEIVEKHWKKVFYASIIMIFFVKELQTLSMKIGLGFIFIPLGTTYGTIANFAIGFLMMYLVFGPQKIWFKFFNSSIINYIGSLSYSIYLWQQIFISGSGHWVTKYPQNLLFILLTAMSSYHLIEMPFIKLKKKFAVQKKLANKHDVPALAI